MRNDGVPSTAGDAGVVGVGASAAPGLGRLLPLFGAAFFKAGVAACGVLEAWTWRAAAMASSPARSSSVSPFRDSAERGVVGSGCMCYSGCGRVQATGLEEFGDGYAGTSGVDFALSRVD